MKKVYWTIPDYGIDALQIVFPEPESLFKHLQDTRRGNVHLRCPAFQDYVKNTFVIRSPFDFDITVDKVTGSLQVEGLTQDIATKFIVNRIDEIGPGNPYVVSAPPVYLFYATEDVQIESIHPSMEMNTSVPNIMMIPGTYNIAKWIRPVDFSFEIRDYTKPVSIKRGDAIFYVKFRTPNDDRVELERVPFTTELQNAMRSCYNVNQLVKNVSLKSLYTMASSFIKTLSFNRTKKCPFGFGKK
jgi:hypothetical protein